MIEFNCRKWLAPVLTSRVGIGIINFIKFYFESSYHNLLSGLEKEINMKFPPILILMNINGCLVHRTQQKINFLKPESADEKEREAW